MGPVEESDRNFQRLRFFHRPRQSALREGWYNTASSSCRLSVLGGVAVPVVHNIFVIHSYRHDGNAQHELIGMLRLRRRFYFQDHSIPNVSLYRGMRLKAEIRKRMSLADVVLMLARPAAGKSVHVRFEVRLATELGKPIIAIRPREGLRTSSFAQQHALTVVDWDVDQIVHQIRNPGKLLRDTEMNVRDETTEAGVANSFLAPPQTRLPDRDEILKGIARLDTAASTFTPLPHGRNIFE